MKNNRSLTIPFALGQAGFWMSLCIAVSFAAVHLKALGFSNTELGLVMAAGNILGTVFGPMMASLAEKNSRLTTAAVNRPLFAVRVLLLTGLLFCGSRTLISALLYTFYIAAMQPVNSLNLKFCVDAERRGLKLDYGKARAAGSFAFVVISALLGLLFKRWSYPVLIWAAFAVLLFQVFANEMTAGRLSAVPLSEETRTQTQKSATVLAFLRGEPRFALFLLGSVLLYFSHNTITNFMINIVRNLGGDEETMGYINAFLAVVEIPVMLLSTRLFQGKRVSVLLQLSVAMFFFKGLAFALAPSIPVLVAANLLQAPSFALYCCAVVPYVSTVIPRENSAKAQSLAFSMTTLGAVVASMIGGWLFDRCSVRQTLLIAAAVCLLGVAICIPTVKKTERSPRAEKEISF